MSRPAPDQPRPQSPQVAGKLIALDVGLSHRRATCDPLRLSVRPLLTLTRASRRQDFARLAALVTEQEAVAVICGLPLNMDGSDSDQTRSVRKWAMRLAHALRALLGRPFPVIFWDERLSTYAAQQLLEGDEPRRGESSGDASPQPSSCAAT